MSSTYAKRKLWSNMANLGLDENFAYEARLIHYKDKNKAKGGIYGNASLDQLKELKEEGIETEIVPWVNEKDN